MLPGAWEGHLYPEVVGGPGCNVYPGIGGVGEVELAESGQVPLSECSLMKPRLAQVHCVAEADPTSITQVPQCLASLPFFPSLLYSNQELL